MQLMPHESTVDHSATMKSIRQQSYKRQESVGDQGTDFEKIYLSNIRTRLYSTFSYLPYFSSRMVEEDGE